MYVVAPGIHNSGSRHWQTRWETEWRERGRTAKRILPQSWSEPELQDWMVAFSRAVRQCSSPPVVVAHSLGCLMVAHWASSDAAVPLSGAFLVSVPDPEGENFPSAALSFGACPWQRLPFPALVVASTNDPFGRLSFQRRRSEAWGAGFVTVGPHGHINENSELGLWEQGWQLLAAFLGGLREPF